MQRRRLRLDEIEAILNRYYERFIITVDLQRDCNCTHCYFDWDRWRYVHESPTIYEHGKIVKVHWYSMIKAGMTLGHKR